MRPKKKILLIDPDEDRRGITRLTLSTQGFAVLSASSIHSAQFFDSAELILSYTPIDDEWVVKMSQMLTCPSILMADKRNQEMSLVDATLLLADTSTAELIDRIKVMTARKRGPKKKPVQSVIDCESVKMAG